jgi:hypothetical protein
LLFRVLFVSCCRSHLNQYRAPLGGGARDFDLGGCSSWVLHPRLSAGDTDKESYIYRANFRLKRDFMYIHILQIVSNTHYSPLIWNCGNHSTIPPIMAVVFSISDTIPIRLSKFCIADGNVPKTLYLIILDDTGESLDRNQDK